MNLAKIRNIVFMELAILLMLLTLNSCSPLDGQTLKLPAHHTATGFRNPYIKDPEKIKESLAENSEKIKILK